MNHSQNSDWQPGRPGKGGRRSHGHGSHGFGPGSFGPGGFGPGDLGFGPGFGRGPGRRGGRNRRGQVRESILALLTEQPLNGYQIMQAIAERTQGLWRPSPGAVYPALAQLEDEGLIEAFDNEGQKAYRLTEAGTETAKQNDAPWDAFTTAFGDRDPDTIQALFKELGGLAGAAKELVRNGTADQVSAAVGIVSDARRRIYGLLATDPGTPNADDLR